MFEYAGSRKSSPGVRNIQGLNRADSRTGHFVSVHTIPGRVYGSIPMGRSHRLGAELFQTEHRAHASASGTARRSGCRQPSAALEHPRPARSALRIETGRAGDSRPVGNAQNAARSNGESAHPRLRRAHRQIHQAVLAERRYRCLTHSIFRHGGTQLLFINPTPFAIELEFPFDISQTTYSRMNAK